MKIIDADTTKSYPIYLGDCIWEKSLEELHLTYGNCKVAVLTDYNVNHIYGERFIKKLRSLGFLPSKITFLSDEYSKNLNTFSNIVKSMSDDGFSKTDIVIGLGGGVVLDVAGYVAASYLNGIGLAQFPTTLLAAIECPIVRNYPLNVGHTKDIISLYKAPSLVCIDLLFFTSLTEELFRDGEIAAIKYAIVSDSSLLNHINDKNYEYIVERCISISKSLWHADPTGKSLSFLLAYGSTTGRAIESSSAFNIPYPKALALGYILEAKAAAYISKDTTQVTHSITSLLDTYYKDILIKISEIAMEDICSFIMTDQKVRCNAVTIIVPETIGKCHLHKINLDDIASYLESSLK